MGWLICFIACERVCWLFTCCLFAGLVPVVLWRIVNEFVFGLEAVALCKGLCCVVFDLDCWLVVRLLLVWCYLLIRGLCL